ncbi:MAG: monofunctional biosynthetic peptidoglycan transglycosylase [Thiotrichales bacterium]
MGRFKSRRFPFRRVVIAVMVVGLVLPLALVLPLRWFDPFTSSVILQHRFGLIFERESPFQVRHVWVPLAALGAELPLAVVAGEDQRFPEHRGFDLHSIRQALAASGDGGRLRGASTLSQQVAKNLFLWQGRSWLRKGLEAYFTVLIEALWPKWRILEVYLNIAQWGEHRYGAGAASQTYFGKPPEQLSRREAALLAAVLPNPARLRVDAPSSQVLARAEWIRGQMGQLGSAWLRDVLPPTP